MRTNRIVGLVLLAAAAWPFVSRLVTGQWPRLQGSMDFQDGIRLDYEMDADDLLSKGITTAAARQKALEEAKGTFRFRLGEFDRRKDLNVRTAGDRSLVVEVPGVEDLQSVLSLIGNPQVLTFRVIQEGNEHEEIPGEPCFRRPGERMCQDVGPSIIDYSKFDYANVRVQPDESEGLPNLFAVTFEPKNEYEQEWLDATRPLYGKVLGICLDDVIMVSAVDEVKGGIRGEAEITGHYSGNRAHEIEKLLRAGPLPVKFNNTQQRQLSRSVGPEMLNRAFEVLGIGMAAICLILFLAYSNNRELFIIVLMGQAVQASIICFLSSHGYFALSMLSLCGLSIMSGVCIDNVILINEEILLRIRDEDTGSIAMRGVIDAVQAAFREEWPIVLMANLSSLLPVLPLYLLGEPVASFVTTMLAAIAFALCFVWLVVRTLLESNWVVGGLENVSRSLHPVLPLKFDLGGYRKEFRIVYLLAAVVATGLLFSRGLARGIDFQQGTEITIQADQEVEPSQLERAAMDYFGKRCSVRRVDQGVLHVGQSSTYFVLVPGFVPDTDTESRYSIKVDGFAARLNSSFPAHFVQTSAVSAGATVTGITMGRFLLSAGFGILLLSIWLSIRAKFGVAFWIVAAMLMDSVISLGALSLYAVPLSLPIVSSLLAIVGYSVYDSIVVTYHLRAALWKSRGNEQEIVAKTLKRLSRRMILTMASTSISALGVAFFCGGLLQDFGIIMAAGSMSGMISTIAIVVPGAEAAFRRPTVAQRSVAATS